MLYLIIAYATKITEGQLADQSFARYPQPRNCNIGSQISNEGNNCMALANTFV
jgi:hypothetical protein